MYDGDQTARAARRPADRGLRDGSRRRPSKRYPLRSGRHAGGGGGPPALRPMGRRGLRPRHGHLFYRRGGGGLSGRGAGWGKGGKFVGARFFKKKKNNEHGGAT